MLCNCANHSLELAWPTLRPFRAFALLAVPRLSHVRPRQSQRAADRSINKQTAKAVMHAAAGGGEAALAPSAAHAGIDTSLLASKALQQHPCIILGTASSARRAVMDELAAQYGFVHEVLKADIDESAIRHPDARQLVLLLARAKAAAIAGKLEAEGRSTQGLLITCDQVVLHEGKILEKPTDESQARQFIAGYARAPASTVGSVVLTDLATGRSWEGVDVATIHFEPIPPATVDALIEEGEVYWCAGGLMVEHPLVAPHVTRMEGTLDSVMGLSKQLLLDLLCRAAADGEAGAPAEAAEDGAA